MNVHYETISQAHEMGVVRNAVTAEFLETDSDGRERMLAQLVNSLLSETTELDIQTREQRSLVVELLNSDEVQSIAPSPVLMALMDRIRIRFRIDSNLSQ